jgi:hypothetical protein
MINNDFPIDTDVDDTVIDYGSDDEDFIGVDEDERFYD